MSKTWEFPFKLGSFLYVDLQQENPAASLKRKKPEGDLSGEGSDDNGSDESEEESEPKQPANKKKKKDDNVYDLQDPFIDDGDEFMGEDKDAKKNHGFVIFRGSNVDNFFEGDDSADFESESQSSPKDDKKAPKKDKSKEKEREKEKEKDKGKSPKDKSKDAEHHHHHHHHKDKSKDKDKEGKEKKKTDTDSEKDKDKSSANKSKDKDKEREKEKAKEREKEKEKEREREREREKEKEKEREREREREEKERELLKPPVFDPETFPKNLLNITIEIADIIKKTHRFSNDTERLKVLIGLAAQEITKHPATSLNPKSSYKFARAAFSAEASQLQGFRAELKEQLKQHCREERDDFEKEADKEVPNLIEKAQKKSAKADKSATPENAEEKKKIPFPWPPACRPLFFDLVEKRLLEKFLENDEKEIEKDEYDVKKEVKTFTTQKISKHIPKDLMDKIAITKPDSVWKDLRKKRPKVGGAEDEDEESAKSAEADKSTNGK